MKIKKAYYSLRKTDAFDANRVVYMAPEEAKEYVISRTLMPFRSAYRMGLYKPEEPRETKKRTYERKGKKTNSKIKYRRRRY